MPLLVKLAASILVLDTWLAWVIICAGVSNALAAL